MTIKDIIKEYSPRDFDDIMMELELFAGKKDYTDKKFVLMYYDEYVKFLTTKIKQVVDELRLEKLNNKILTDSWQKGYNQAVDNLEAKIKLLTRG